MYPPLNEILLAITLPDALNLIALILSNPLILGAGLAPLLVIFPGNTAIPLAPNVHILDATCVLVKIETSVLTSTLDSY